VDVAKAVVDAAAKALATTMKSEAAEVAKPQAVEAAKPQAVEMAKVEVPKLAAKPAIEESRMPLPPATPSVESASISPDELPPGSVKVNVEELEARIAACNLALRELEADLAEKSGWDAAKLEPLVDRLKVLVVRHNDLGMFRDVAPKAQRSDITPLEAPKSAISQLSAHVVEARTRANDTKVLTDEVERRAELTRLEAVSHQLAELAEKK
jgi:hypothetical protein